MTWAGYVLVGLLVWSFFDHLQNDGKPQGTYNADRALIGIMIVIFLYWQAGVFG